MLIMGFKASTMDWLTTLNLPSFTFEMEYITTKNANRSHRDARSQFRPIGESLHYVNRAKQRAQNADGRREACERFVHLAGEIVLVLELLHFDFENLPNGLRLSAIDDQLKAFLGKRI